MQVCELIYEVIQVLENCLLGVGNTWTLSDAHRTLGAVPET